MEKADEGNFLGNTFKWAIHKLFIHYITKSRYKLLWLQCLFHNNSKLKIFIEMVSTLSAYVSK